MELTIEKALQQGVTAHKEGKLKDAERFYRAILQSQPTHAAANHNLGLIAVSVSKAKVALPLFQTAIESNPKIGQFWLSYVDALIKEKQFDKASEVTKQAKKQGVAGEKLHKFETLLALEIQITNFETPSQPQLNRLSDYYKNGQNADAEKLARSLTERFPKHQFSWKVLSLVLKKTGSIGESLSTNQKAIQINPQDAESHYNLANTLRELGRLDEAETSYKEAISLKPDFALAHYNLGTALQAMGRFDDSEVSYKQAITWKPDYAEAYNNLGNTLRELGRFDDAEVSYKQAITWKPDYAEPYNNLGNTLQELGRLEEATTNYSQAISLKPNFFLVHYNLGNTLQLLGRVDEVEASYKKATVWEPNYALAYSNLGNTLQELGRLDESIELYNKALTIQPDDASFLLNLGTAKRKAVPNWHLPMMNENTRNVAYQNAMKSAIQRDDVVLDIGTGAGLLSMIAADCGASEIVTCEMSKTISKIAEKIITKNGYDHKIRIINKNSKDLIIGRDIDEKVDILVSEILSSEFVGEGIQKTVLDAKRRLLKRTGKMIPEGGSIMIALIENTGKLAKELFVDNALGYNISDFNSITTNKYVGTLEDEPVFLSDPIEAFSFDFCNFENIYRDTKTIKIKVNRSGACAGIIQWIKVQLYGDIKYQNNPVEMYRSNSVSGWKTPIFKFNRPVNAIKGQSLNVNATLTEDYSWFNLDSF